MGYRIITDATCDLPPEIIAELDVTVLPMDYTIDGESRSYNPQFSGTEIRDLVDAMIGGKTPVTSQINTFTFANMFEPVFKEGEDIIFICFSSALSSQYSSSLVAAEQLCGKYAGRRAVCIDSRCASGGEGLLVYYAARRRSELDFDGMVSYIESIKQNIVHWFTVDDLQYLKRGGRISGATAAMGTILNVKPIMHVDEEGRLISTEKAKGRKKSLKALVAKMKLSFDKQNADVVIICNMGALEDAEYVKLLVCEECGISNIIMSNIGPSVGSHSGPGTIALFFYGDRKAIG